eukprot:5910706-Pleurochrysis_carterae.AAC.3
MRSNSRRTAAAATSSAAVAYTICICFFSERSRFGNCLAKHGNAAFKRACAVAMHATSTNFDQLHDSSRLVAVSCLKVEAAITEYIDQRMDQ